MGVDAHSGRVHPVLGTAAHISDVTVADHWRHGQEQRVHADAGDQGVAKRPEHHKRPVDWQVRRHRIGGRPGQAEAMRRAHRLKERAQAAIRAKVEPVFRTVKCPFGFTKVRYQGLAKNTAQ